MSKTGINQNVMKCVLNNSSTGWYDTDAAGATILPTTDPCRTAVIDVQYDRNKALSSAIRTADHGASAQKIMAKRVLRAACDQGGTGACDYFINTCLLNGLVASPFCDDATDYTDITYYLHLNRTTYVNNGATYIVSQLEPMLLKMITNLSSETILLNEVENDKTTAPNANNNLATALIQPAIYIKACKNGITAACQTAYNNNYNRSCYQIRTNWLTAPSDTYELTYNAAGDTDSIYCDMSSLPSSIITGCNSITANLLTNAPVDDCTYGYDNSYNQSCNLIAFNWTYAPAGTYNLTTDGAPPTALVSSACPAATPACVTSGIGTVCPDGSVYAGDYSGHHYYTTPSDQGYFAWANGPTDTFTNTNSLSDGQTNTSILLGLTNPPDLYAPYKAAGACQALNDASTYGYTDWYLPARDELTVLNTNRAAIGNFATSQYWTSSEQNVNRANYWTIGSNSYYTEKWNYFYVRCIRQKAALDGTCPNPGDTCADGTKYAGPYSTYFLFTTPFDQGQYAWNNGTYAAWLYTNAKDNYYGMNNYNKIMTLSADTNAPYRATLACKALNDASTYGHTDWYLPARYELDLLATNRIAIGGFLIQSYSYYWSSTEITNLTAYFRDIQSGTGASMKTNGYRVRCVRRD